MIASASAAVGETRRVSGTGEVLLARLTQEQARGEALAAARNHAISQAGIEVVRTMVRNISEEDAVHSYDHFAEFTSTISRVLIVEEKVVLDTLLVAPGRPPTCKVEIEAKVRDQAGKLDPSFRLELALAQRTLRAGEKLELTINASKECFLTVFNLYGGDSLGIVLPNSQMQATRVSPGRPLRVPPEEAHWSLPVGFSEADPSSDLSEALLAVATRDSIPFPVLGEPATPHGLVATENALTSIHSWLARIERDRRTQHIVHYRIVR